VKLIPHPTPEELLLDESFLNYYFKKNEADVWEWEEFLEDYPQHQATVMEAVAILDRLSLKWSEDQIRTKYAQLESNLNQNTPSVGNVLPLPIQQYRWSWAVGMAAAVLILMGFWNYFKNDQASPIYKELVAKQSLIERVNTSERPLLIALADGSSILLQKGSRLSYPKQFNAAKREVYLDGEAFFEVAKNPTQPFYVYANEIVTKVLGTSFSINARNARQDIKVVVHTGKVSVYKLNYSTKTQPKRELEGVVITQNQALVFNRDIASFAKSLVTDPQIVKESQVYDFEFKDEAASHVFEKLQKAYGIEIVYDEVLLRDCPVTASLTDEPLYGKLDLVCRAIEAHYEIVDGQVIVNSKGCK
jgi:transmembrane sensor